MTFFTIRELPFELDGHCEVEISVVPLIGLHYELANNFFARLDGEVIIEVEYSLFPVSVPGLGGSGEASALVALCELDIEVCDKSVHVVVAAHLNGIE